MSTTSRSLSWAEPEALAALLSRAAAPRPPRRPADRLGGEPVEPLLAPRGIAPLAQVSKSAVDQLEALTAWTLISFGGRSVFVADEDGLALSVLGVSEMQAALFGPLLAAQRRVRAAGGQAATAGALYLDEGLWSWVELAPVGGRRVHLAVLGDAALSRVQLDQLRAAFETTMFGLVRNGAPGEQR